MCALAGCGTGRLGLSLRVETTRRAGIDAPVGQFSAARAMEYVRQIAQRPHFIGTHENDGVRDYLVQQLKALGGSVEVGSAVGIHGHHKSVFAASVQNVVATFRGSANIELSCWPPIMIP